MAKLIGEAWAELDAGTFVRPATPLLRADATDDDLQVEEDDNPAPDGDTADDGIVEPKRQVPVVVQGVLHGYREDV